MRETIYKLLQIIDELEDDLGPAGYEIISEVAEGHGVDLEYLKTEYNGDYRHKTF